MADYDNYIIQHSTDSGNMVEAGPFRLDKSTAKELRLEIETYNEAEEIVRKGRAPVSAS